MIIMIAVGQPVKYAMNARVAKLALHWNMPLDKENR